MVSPLPRLALIGAISLMPVMAQASDCPARDVNDLGSAHLGAGKARAEAGLERLKLNQTLSEVAHAHGCDLAARGVLDHKGSDGSGVLDRVRGAGLNCTSAAENLASGRMQAASVIEAWKGSPAHNANLLGKNFTDAGYARIRLADGGSIWVAVFATCAAG